MPGAAGQALAGVKVGASCEVAVLAHADGAEAAVLAHGHAAVEQQVSVEGQIHRALLVEEGHVALEPAAVGEALHEARHDVALGGRELVGVVGVERGEVAGGEVVVLARDADLAVRAVGEVELVEQKAVGHVELGMAPDELALQLEHDDRDGLLDRGEHVLLGVGLLGEECQLAQGDAVGALEDVEGVVVDGVPHHRGDAGLGAGRRAHPADVVVAPLDVERVVGHEAVHDDVAVGTAVVDVAHDVQVVDGEALDERRERSDEVADAARLEDGLDDALVVDVAVGLLAAARVEELVDDVGVGHGHGLPHLGARVGVREVTGELDELHKGRAVPRGRVLALLLDALELLVGVVDEGAELGLLAGGELVAEDRFDALADDARAVVDDVVELLRVAVDVGDEVLGGLGQVEDGLEVDDLGVDGLAGGELLRE